MRAPIGIAVAALCVVVLILRSFSAMLQKDGHDIFIPQSLEELKELRGTLLYAVQAHPVSSLLAFSSLYVFKQTFAIPGSFILNLAAGALFGTWMGSVLVSALTVTGASMCFLLSSSFGSTLRAMPAVSKHIDVLEKKVVAAKASGTLFYFLLSARVVPFTPNWALNIASPWFGVPWHLFAASVVLGLFPYNFISVRAGTMLTQISSPSDVLDTWTMLQLIGLASAAVAPALCRCPGRSRKAATPCP